MLTRAIIASVIIVFFILFSMQTQAHITKVDSRDCFDIAKSINLLELDQTKWACQTLIKSAYGMTYDACIKIDGSDIKAATNELHQTNQALTSALENYCDHRDKIWANLLNIDLLIDNLNL